MKPTCSTEGCGKAAKIKGKCQSCYDKARAAARKVGWLAKWQAEWQERTRKYPQMTPLEQLEYQRDWVLKQLGARRHELEEAERNLAAIDHVLERVKAGQIDFSNGLESALAQTRMELVVRRMQLHRLLIERGEDEKEETDDSPSG